MYWNSLLLQTFSQPIRLRLTREPEIPTVTMFATSWNSLPFRGGSEQSVIFSLEMLNIYWNSLPFRGESILSRLELCTNNHTVILSETQFNVWRCRRCRGALTGRLPTRPRQAAHVPVLRDGQVEAAAEGGPVRRCGLRANRRAGRRGDCEAGGIQATAGGLPAGRRPRSVSCLSICSLRISDSFRLSATLSVVSRARAQKTDDRDAVLAVAAGSKRDNHRGRGRCGIHPHTTAIGDCAPRESAAAVWWRYVVPTGR